MMTNMEYDTMATISAIEYRKVGRTDPNGNFIGEQDVLYIDFEDAGYININNTGFAATNWSLMLQAYLGVRPSTLDDAVGKTLPMCETPEQEFESFPPDWVFDKGKQMLIDSDWGPQVGTEIES